MKVHILGCGSAGGVPSLSRGWGECDPSNPKNRRRRPSIMIEQGRTQVLVDTGADIREQLWEKQIRHLDGVIYTHDHADHLNGIDDLREINRAMMAPIPIYGFPEVMANIQTRFSYVIGGPEEGSAGIFRPMLLPNAVNESFAIGNVTFLPIEQDHGYGRTMGIRFGDFAYSTDLVHLSEAAFEILAGTRVWIIGCLMRQPHPTHAHLDRVLEWIARVKPERAILTHMTPLLDYQSLKESLPTGIEPAYDGMILTQP